MTRVLSADWVLPVEGAPLVGGQPLLRLCFAKSDSTLTAAAERLCKL